MRKDFDAAVEALYRAALEPEAVQSLTFEQVRTIRVGLLRLLYVRSFDLPAEDLNEAVSEATLKFIRAVRTGRVLERKAAAYLTTIALHEGENVRRVRTTVSLEGAGSDVFDRAYVDDEASRTDERLASAEIVESLMRTLITKGDHSCAKILAVWLDESQRLGHRPSNRDVAEVAGVTHPTVARCLRVLGALAREMDTMEGGGLDVDTR